MTRVALALAAFMAVLVPPAAARTVTASGGDVTATLTYARDGIQAEAQRLTIARAGSTLFDGEPNPLSCDPFECGPTVGFGKLLKPLRVVDLDGGGEPEVLYNAYTGGAHCCVVGQVYWLDDDATGYKAADRNFGSSGYRQRDLGRDGVIELVASDWRFEGALTAYAFSGSPVQIFHFADGRFEDVTRAYPARLRRDARFWRRLYVKLRHRKDGTEYGAVAAWAADRYLLRRRDATLRFLHREARRGLLQPGGRRFVGRLDGFLLRLGYG